MEEQHPNYILDWPYLHNQKSTEELTQSLWSTTMELELTRIRVQDEIKSKDDELNQLKTHLNEVINERNDARNKYKSLLVEKMVLQQQFHNYHRKTTVAPPYSGVSSIEDEPIINCGFSSSDCEESIVSSPVPAPENGSPEKLLPENGKFLEAVMKAGPLLQNLLLAGPLPHWRHPPPPLEGYQIPPFNKKRGFYEDCDSSSETKYQRISLS